MTPTVVSLYAELQNFHCIAAGAIKYSKPVADHSYTPHSGALRYARRGIRIAANALDNRQEGLFNGFATAGLAFSE